MEENNIIDLKQYASNSKKNPLTSVNLNTPRTKEACKILGIDIRDLKPKTLSDFQVENLDEEVIKLRYEHYNKKLKSDFRKIKAYKIQKYGRRLEMVKDTLTARAQLGISDWVFRSDSPPQSASFVEHDRMEKSRVELKLQKHKNEVKRLIDMDQKRIESEVKWNQKLKKIEQTQKNKDQKDKEIKAIMEAKFVKAKEKFQKLESEKLKQQKMLQIKMNKDISEAIKREKQLKQQQKLSLMKREQEAERKRKEKIQ